MSTTSNKTAEATLRTIFGSLDNCQCEHCMSVYSPSAYFTDLLNFLMSGSKEVYDELILRRKDLINIDLSCDNAFTPMPYVDLVIERLENYILEYNVARGVSVILPPASFQTIGTAQELAANPQHMYRENNDEYLSFDDYVKAYEFLTQSVYPFVLPFNYFLEEARVYIKHLGIPRHEIMTAFFSGNELSAFKDLDILSERFGISPEEMKIITGETTGEISADPEIISGIWNFYGFNKESGYIGIIDPLDSSNLLTAGKWNKWLTGRVDVFLQQTGLTYKEMLGLLNCDFINPIDDASTGQRKIVIRANADKTDSEDTCELNHLFLDGLRTVHLQNIHRILRLWKKLGWTIYDLDKAAKTFGITTLGNPGLKNICQSEYLRNKLSLPAEVIFSFYSNIGIVDYTDFSKDNYPAISSLYNKLFLNKSLLSEPDAAFNDPESLIGDIGEEHKPTILAGLQITSDDYDTLLNSDEVAFDGKLNLDNLSELHRYSVLSKKLGYGIEDFLSLKKLIGINPFSKAESTFEFLQKGMLFKKSGFSLVEINYLLKNEYTEESGIAPTNDEISVFLSELRAAIRTIESSTDDEQKNTIIQKLSEKLQISTTSSNLLLQTKLTGSNEKIIDSFWKEDFETSDFLKTYVDDADNTKNVEPVFVNGEPDTTTDEVQVNVENLFACYINLYKVSVFINKLKLSDTDLNYIFNNSLELECIEFVNILNSATSASYEEFKKLIELIIARDLLPVGETDFFEIIDQAVNTDGTLETWIDTLVSRTLWEKEVIEYLVKSIDGGISIGGILEAKFPEDFNKGELIIRIKKCIDIINKLGLKHNVIHELSQNFWTDPNIATGVSQSVKSAAKAKYDESKWLNIAKPLRDQLREKQRTALVAYVLTHPDTALNKKWKNTDEMYEYFLLDVEMKPLNVTSKLKQAISSVQLFIDRVLLGVEYHSSDSGIKKLNLEEDQAEEWKEWRKLYRIWEANRKIFLYAENWIEPELRDNKSPFFEELESQLLQNELTEDNIENAYYEYLRKLDEVARLEVVGMYHQLENADGDDADEITVDILHVIARTNSNPHKYFYRRFEKNEWSPWETMEIDIDSDHFVPVVYNRRLCLFWLFFLEQTEESDGESVIKYWKIQIAWSEYKNGNWSGKKLSKSFVETEHTQSSKRMTSVRESIFPYAIVGDELKIMIQNYYDFVISSSEENSGSDSGSDNTQFISDLDVLIAKLNNLINSKNNGDKDESTKLYEKFFSALQEFKQSYSNNNSEFKTALDDLINIYWKTKDGNITPYKFGKKKDQFIEKYSPSAEIETETQTETNYLIQFIFNDTNSEPHVNYVSPSSDEYEEIIRKYSNAYPTDMIVSNNMLKESTEGSHKLFNDLFEYQSFEIISLSSNYFIYYWASTDQKVILKETNEKKFKIVVPPNYDIDPLGKEFFFQDWKNTFYVTSTEGEKDMPEFVISDFDFEFQTSIIYNEHFDPDFYEKEEEINYFEFNEYENPYKNDSYNMPNYAPDILKNTNKSVDKIKVKGHDNSISFEDEDFTFSTFYHPHVKAFIKSINKYGIDGLLKRSVQNADNVITFEKSYNPTNAVTTPYPKGKVDFYYGASYSIYNWELFFHTPMLIACKLSTDQRFEESREWFHYIFDPTASNTNGKKRFWNFYPFYSEAGKEPMNLEEFLAIESEDLENQIEKWMEEPFQPHVIARMRISAYMKNVVMKYLDNLFAWGDNLFRRDTIESINEATNLYILASKILGPRPQDIPPRTSSSLYTFKELSEDSSLGDFSNALVQIESFLYLSGAGKTNYGTIPSKDFYGDMFYFCIIQNENLLKYWDTVADRLFKIRNSMNIEGIVRTLALYEPPIDPALLVRAAAMGMDLSSILNDISSPLPNYRFVFMVQKANELCNEVKSLGASLLSALEKKDAEAMALLRSSQEQNVLKEVLELKEKQVEEAEENVENAEKAIDLAKFKYNYYSGRKFINDQEEIYFKSISKGLELSLLQANAEERGAFLSVIPDFSTTIPPHTSFGGSFLANINRFVSAKFASEISMNNVKGIMSSTLGGYIRRKEDWKFQEELADLEIKQSEIQKLAAEIRLSVAQKNLENHKLQIDNASETDAFMRSKFTSKQLYDWMTGQLATVFFQSYQLAYDISKKAQKCYNYELGKFGGEEESFVQFGYWDSLKKGLLSGEKLSYDLKRMENSFYNNNVRDYEITKHISLAMLDANALLDLRSSGICEFKIPELLFEMDFADHYLRKIKSVSLSIPCIAGPYTSISAQLSLLKSYIRIDKVNGSGFIGDDEDSLVKYFIDGLSNFNSIATSNAQNDAGMFELNFRDERYLAFEGAGVISDWNLELPTSAKQFDYNTISDVIITIRYTAKKSTNSAFKENVNNKLTESVADSIISINNGGGFCRLLSLKHEFSTDFYKMQQESSYAISVGSNYFPYFTKSYKKKLISIDLFDADNVEIPVEILISNNVANTEMNDDWKLEFDIVNSAELKGLSDVLVLVTYNLE